MTTKYLIGIDPGVTTGMAIYCRETKSYETITSSTITVAMETLLRFCTEHKGNVRVRLEDSRLRKWFANAGREKLQGAGSIKRDCQILEEFLTHHAIPFELVAPKNNRTKLDAATFRKYTGWQGKTNEHQRDAGMLVAGL